MFAYELTGPTQDPAYTTSAGRADAIATALVNTCLRPIHYRIYWAMPDGTHADIAADVLIPADLDSPYGIAALRRRYENQLRARMIRGQLPLAEDFGA
jgi:hypothetical protein